MGVPTGQIRVLHVDDDPDLAALAAEFIAREDDTIEVEAVTTARTGLDRLDEGGIDCVVSDFEMPGLNGIEFLERVRETHPELPFILFTGKGSEEVASDAISAGVTDYLQKRHSADQYALLVNRIRNAVAAYRANLAVRENEEWTTTLLTHSSDFLMVVDEDGRIAYVSPSVARVMGYDAGELTGTPAFEFVHPDDAAAAEEGYRSVLNRPTEEIVTEFRAVDASGDVRWLEVRGRDLRDDPVVEGVLVNVRDVTNRRTLEADLEVALDRYQTLVEQNVAGIYIIGPDGFEYVNPKTCEIAGYSEDELLAMEPLDLIRPVDADAAERNIEARLSGEADEIDYTLSFERGDGDRRIARAHGAQIEFDGEPAILGTLVDITERTERERELDRLREHTAFALAETDTYVWVWDPETGETETIYRPLETVTGVPTEAIESAADFIEKAVHPDDQERVANEYERVVTGAADRLRVEYRTHPDTGLDRWLAAAGYMRDDDDGQLLIGLLSDVTERRRQQASIERQNERLEAFAAALTHDLRNPLSVAMASLELARGDTDADADTVAGVAAGDERERDGEREREREREQLCRGSEHLDRAEGALERMEALLSDLLTLARDGREVGDSERVELHGLVEAGWAAVDTRDATLRVETARVVRADRSRLQQVFENLFRNAVVHGGDGVTVTVGDHPDGFYVEDDGTGLPTGNDVDVLDPGFTTADGGLGLGLGIVRTIVEAHGWALSVTNGPDGGARFEITGVEESD